VIQRRTPSSLIDAGMLRGLGTMLAIGAGAGAVVAWLRPFWLDLLGRTGGSVLLVRGLDALGGLVLGVLIFLILAKLLRLPEVGALLRWRGLRATGEPGG
jgi:hypothetical protein